MSVISRRGRGDSPRGLLLKDVQHVDGRPELDGVDRPIRIAIVIFDNLQDARAVEPSEWLGARMFPADLSNVESEPNGVLYFRWTGPKIIMAVADPYHRPHAAQYARFGKHVNGFEGEPVEFTRLG